MSADERRLAWDDRHRGGDFEGEGPNTTLAAAVADLPRGRTLELACGSGTNAVWLASQGFETTAVDWSAVGLANGKLKADTAAVHVEWLERNLLDWAPPARSFDLVVVVYLHLTHEERQSVYAKAAAALARGGRLLVVAHHPQNAVDGFVGPPPERMFTAEDLAADLFVADPSLGIERADVVRRPDADRPPIDTLLIVRRPNRSAPR